MVGIRPPGQALGSLRREKFSQVMGGNVTVAGDWEYNRVRRGEVLGIFFPKWSLWEDKARAKIVCFSWSHALVNFYSKYQFLFDYALRFLSTSPSLQGSCEAPSLSEFSGHCALAPWAGSCRKVPWRDSKGWVALSTTPGVRGCGEAWPWDNGLSGSSTHRLGEKKLHCRISSNWEILKVCKPSLGYALSLDLSIRSLPSGRIFCLLNTSQHCLSSLLWFSLTSALTSLLILWLSVFAISCSLLKMLPCSLRWFTKPFPGCLTLCLIFPSAVSHCVLQRLCIASSSARTSHAVSLLLALLMLPLI